MLRREIPIEWEGTEYRVQCTPALLLRIEDKVEGISINEALLSGRLTDHAWIVTCALRECGVPLPGEKGFHDVVQATMDNMAYFADRSKEVMIELVLPEAARDLGDGEGGTEGNGEGEDGST